MTLPRKIEVAKKYLWTDADRDEAFAWLRKQPEYTDRYSKMAVIIEKFPDQYDIHPLERAKRAMKIWRKAK